jgi:hypothetical protein
MLIIEGPDMIGKTTLCKKLLKELNTTYNMPHIYAHFSKLPKAWDFFWDYIQRMSRNIVQDRFHLSEIVYAHVCRYREGGTPLYPEKYRLIDAHLRTLGGVTVVLSAEAEWMEGQLHEKFHVREEMFKADQIMEVNRVFHMLGDGTQPEEFQWNYFEDGSGIDIDFHYVMDNHMDYPAENEEFVKAVINKYVQRQTLLDSILRKGTGPCRVGL